MDPICPGCGAPALSSLAIDYRYPRDVIIPEAVDPWHVQGSAPLCTCGSIECEAAGLLAAIDKIVTDSAVHFGHLLNPEDVHIINVGHPGDCTGIFIVDDESA